MCVRMSRRRPRCIFQYMAILIKRCRRNRKKQVVSSAYHPIWYVWNVFELYNNCPGLRYPYATTTLCRLFYFTLHFVAGNLAHARWWRQPCTSTSRSVGPAALSSATVQQVRCDWAVAVVVNLQPNLAGCQATKRFLDEMTTISGVMVSVDYDTISGCFDYSALVLSLLSLKHMSNFLNLAS